MISCHMQKSSAKRQSFFLVSVIPPRYIPTPDSVVYNNSIFNRDAQGNPVFARFLLFKIINSKCS